MAEDPFWSSNTTFYIHPIAYQSCKISFTEWVSLLTLCLAPLIAHIAAGVPQPSFLHERSPRWHERIGLYNPTTILWRYAAIADRRIRAKYWDRKVFAATNALFWTSRGWDGSEEMITLSSPYCTHLPEHTRIALFSRESIKTLIVTLQGTQAVVSLGLALGGKSASDGFVTFMGVDLIFFPLAFIGLVRLFCAFWLTDDFAYASLRSTALVGDDSTSAKVNDTRVSMDSLLGDGTTDSSPKEDRFLPTSYLWSKVFRGLFLFPLLGLWVVCLLFILQPEGGKMFTATSFLMALFYLVFISASIFICGFYLARGHSSTTIPSIGSVWYKCYTGLLLGMVLVIFVVACIETRHTTCGKWTSAPYSVGDFWACSDSRTPDIIAVDPDSLPAFGLATTKPSYDQHNETLGDGEFWVRNFTGHCLGRMGNTTVKLASTREVVDLRDFQGDNANSYSLWY
ncbi:hypothetical protein F4821DRAFT_255003 [Hypoxylon rubiginosum]|uniref:Uncharacterized protein n=1 Tax=Hypoxylon rubiginosum TaxID=110542 RepID=A0ACC0DH65_9PEZI|nr:hypothetical protein F4821DRAFT_255003 [Hypoxylon rubiginosum]